MIRLAVRDTGWWWGLENIQYFAWIAGLYMNAYKSEVLSSGDSNAHNPYS